MMWVDRPQISVHPACDKQLTQRRLPEPAVPVSEAHVKNLKADHIRLSEPATETAEHSEGEESVYPFRYPF